MYIIPPLPSSPLLSFLRVIINTHNSALSNTMARARCSTRFLGVVVVGSRRKPNGGILKMEYNVAMDYGNWKRKMEIQSRTMVWHEA